LLFFISFPQHGVQMAEEEQMVQKFMQKWKKIREKIRRKDACFGRMETEEEKVPRENREKIKDKSFFKRVLSNGFHL